MERLKKAHRKKERDRERKGKRKMERNREIQIGGISMVKYASRKHLLVFGKYP
jgi:hypothetical protein